MTISQYISQKLTSYGFQSCEADFVDMGIWDSSENLTVDNRDTVHLSFVQFIPSLLLRPQSVSEGGVSISKSTEIKTYYNQECKRLGIRNEFAKRVTFL